MSCQILICNKVGLKGEIATLSNIKNNWTNKETFKSWLASNPNEPTANYHRSFSLLTITDKTVTDLEFITSPLVLNESVISNKWYFIEPSKTSEDWLELFNTGEISKAWASVLPFLKERL
jgi:hypothetical protein